METIRGYYKRLTTSQVDEQRKTLNEVRKRKFAKALEKRERRQKIAARKDAELADAVRRRERERRAEVNRQLNEIVDLCTQCVGRAVSRGHDRALVNLAIGGLWDCDWIELVKRLKSRGYRIKKSKKAAVDRYYIYDGEIYEKRKIQGTEFYSRPGPTRRPVTDTWGWGSCYTYCYRYTIIV
jgi:hypothetical protein